jgi:hypothetical protein
MHIPYSVWLVAMLICLVYLQAYTFVIYQFEQYGIQYFVRLYVLSVLLHCTCSHAFYLHGYFLCLLFPTSRCLQHIRQTGAWDT